MKTDTFRYSPSETHRHLMAQTVPSLHFDGGDDRPWRRDPRVEIVGGDVADPAEAAAAAKGCSAGYYLVHSMMPSARLTQARFEDMDAIIADNFGRAAAQAGVKQIIYLGGLIPQDVELSKHLESREEVERLLGVRAAFEREVRPDGSMRAGRLLAAEFVNSGTPYHAIYFDPNGDGQGSYFDLEGESVRRAFLLKPLSYRRISGRFVNSRRHPVLNTIRAHRGIDYAADSGTPIMATSDGVVVHRGVKGSFGNTVEIRHPNGWITRYAHLRGFRSGVNLGTRVRQSDIIGYVGMTGLASGPHLHYEMLQHGRQFDPLSVDLPAGDPVPSDDMRRWDREMSGRVALLESIPRSGPVRTFAAEADVVAATPAESGGAQGSR